MSALDVLRQIKQARRAKGPTKIIEWGSAQSINDVGIENLTRRELRNHLEARDLPTDGTRLELIERLRSSLADEQQNTFAYKDTMDTMFLIEADLEERGSVYVVGNNAKGQLGLGDLNPRNVFTVVPALRGLHVNYVSTSEFLVFAITDEFDVYVWGGGGVGKTGINQASLESQFNTKSSGSVSSGNSNGSLKNKAAANWMEPQLVKDLGGEEVVNIVIGSSHCVAVGRGGDCFVWGDNDAGQLGLGHLSHHPTVAINNSFPQVKQASAGSNHSAILTHQGKVYTWGHGLNGRLGIGSFDRIGVPDAERHYFPLPSAIPTLERIKSISCGNDYALAIGEATVWAWGSGAGGKLGLGDQKDRLIPCPIPRLKNKSVLQVVASTWHSMAIVTYPPMIGGGWVYTWGSGYHGQLGQQGNTISLHPEVIEYFLEVHLIVTHIAAGSHHSAAVTRDGELYTWGSNAYGCLGREIDEVDVNFTSLPGHVGGFGAIVDRVGRGFPRMVSCGKEYTIVCTWPYVGPELNVALRLMEEERVREEEAVLAATQESELFQAASS